MTCGKRFDYSLEKPSSDYFFSNFSCIKQLKGLHSSYVILKQILSYRTKRQVRDLGLNATLLLCGGQVLTLSSEKK